MQIPKPRMSSLPQSWPLPFAVAVTVTAPLLRVAVVFDGVALEVVDLLVEDGVTEVSGFSEGVSIVVVELGEALECVVDELEGVVDELEGVVEVFLEELEGVTEVE